MGSGASASSDAPHLAEYFKKLAKQTERSMEDQMKLGMEQLTGGAEKINEHKKAMADWYDTEGVPELTKSFKRHDKDDSKALEKEEAKIFFLNLIQETDTFTQALAQSVGQKQLTASVQMLKAMAGAAEAKKIEKQAKALFAEQLKAQKKDYSDRIEAYKKNKDTFDAAAFRVLDTSADDKIQLEEFLAAFHPNSSKQSELLVALGFMTQQEKLMQDHMKKIADGGLVALAPAEEEKKAE